jgi:uridine phosphorylase
VPRTPIHLHPTNDLAERVLLPGDPGRAMLLAQALVDGPKMFNHHRGLWGYTGPAKADGELLTIQATGIGGPSAALILGELAALGVTRAVRVGTGRSASLDVGSVMVADEVRGEDGTSAALSPSSRTFTPDPALRAHLHGDAAGLVVSRDVYVEDGAADGALATDLSSAALLAAGAAHGVAVAVVLGIVPGDAILPEDEAKAIAERVGRAGFAALA